MSLHNASVGTDDMALELSPIQAPMHTEPSLTTYEATLTRAICIPPWFKSINIEIAMIYNVVYLTSTLPFTESATCLLRYSVLMLQKSYQYVPTRLRALSYAVTKIYRLQFPILADMRSQAVILPSTNRHLHTTSSYNPYIRSKLMFQPVQLPGKTIFSDAVIGLVIHNAPHEAVYQGYTDSFTADLDSNDYGDE
ncbi:hypothetical protein C8Q76DRAFT_696718 [Earliella scabrosa]|nr:hypothetical protein C8Q76DRAFT_696718 [Earliella scabrosa]